MRIPKVIRTYCPRCRAHREHSVTLYKPGKRRALAIGERKHEEEKKGYGGQKYARQRRFAKTTKKQTVKLTCKTCGYIQHRKGIRIRRLIIE